MVGQKTTFPQHKKRRHNIFITICAFFVFLSSIISSAQLFFPTQASAATLPASLSASFTPTQAAESYTYANALYWCIQNGGGHTANAYNNPFIQDRISVSNAKTGTWWTQTDNQFNGARLAYASSYLNSSVDSNGQASCNDILKAAVALWSNNNKNWLYTDDAEFLCDITNNKMANGTACRDGNGNYSYSSDTEFANPNDNGGADRFWTIVEMGVYGDSAPSMGFDSDTHKNGAALYDLYYAAFTSSNGCGAKVFSDPGNGSNAYNNVTTVGSDGKPKTQDYQTGNGGSHSDTKKVYVQSKSGSVDNETCQQIAANVTKYSTDASAWLKTNPTTPDQVAGNVDCTKGAITDSNGNPCGATSSTNNQPTCGSTVAGIGWILCPVLTAMGGLDDAMWGVASALLQVSPLDQTSIAYRVWSAFQAIANVALIIIFLIMIFSQLTGQGVSNYGVKKALPRLIIGAILINTSYFIVQILVDVFNILGSSIYGFVNNIIDSNGGWTAPTWQSFLGTVASITAVAGAGVATIAAIGPEAVFFIALPALLAAVIAVLAAVAVLILRQALIPILAVVAPLAFVAYMLPNTKNWFDKWKNLLITMLMVYPLAALLFSGAKMAAVIINGENGGTQWWQTLVALIVMSVPLFMLPFIARQTNPTLAKIGNSIGSRLNKARKPVDNWAGSRKDAATARADASKPGRFNFGKRIRQGFQGRGKERELRTQAYKAQQTADFNTELAANSTALAGSVKGSAAQAYIRGAGARAKAEELKLASAPLLEEIAKVKAAGGNTDEFLEKRAANMSYSSSERAAALHQLAGGGRDDALRRLANNSQVDKTDLQEAINSNAGALINKAPDLVKGTEGAFSTAIKGEDLAAWSKGTGAAYANYLNGLQGEQRIKAQKSLEAAIAQIQNNPTLQSKFTPETGQALAGVVSPGLFDADGRIGGGGTSGSNPNSPGPIGSEWVNRNH